MPKNVVHGSQLNRDEVVGISYGESGRGWSHGKRSMVALGKKIMDHWLLTPRKILKSLIEEICIYNVCLNFEYTLNLFWIHLNDPLTCGIGYNLKAKQTNWFILNSKTHVDRTRSLTCHDTLTISMSLIYLFI